MTAQRSFPPEDATLPTAMPITKTIEETQPATNACQFDASLLLTRHGYERTQERLGSVERLQGLLRAGVRPCLHPTSGNLVLTMEGVTLLVDDKGTGAACVLTDTNEIVTLKPADREELEAASLSPVISIMGKVVLPFEFETAADVESRNIQEPAVMALMLVMLLAIIAMFAGIFGGSGILFGLGVFFGCVAAIGVAATFFALQRNARGRMIQKRVETLGPSLRTQLVNRGVIRSAHSLPRVPYAPSLLDVSHCSVCGSYIQSMWGFCRQCGARNKYKG